MYSGLGGGICSLEGALLPEMTSFSRGRSTYFYTLDGASYIDILSSKLAILSSIGGFG